jgi:hypothetical protein
LSPRQPNACSVSDEENPLQRRHENNVRMFLSLRSILNFILNSLRSLVQVDSNSQAKFYFPDFTLGLHLADFLQSTKTPSLPAAIPQCLRDQVADFKPPPPYPPVAPLYSPHEDTTSPKKSELAPKFPFPPPLTIDSAPSEFSFDLPKVVPPYILPAPPTDNFAPSQPTISVQPMQKFHEAPSREALPRIDGFSPESLEKTDTSNLPPHVQRLLNCQRKELNELRHTNQLLRDQNQTFRSRVGELEIDVSTSVLQLEQNRRQQTQDRAEINRLTTSLENSEEDLATLQQEYRRALANPRKSSRESFHNQILASLRKEHQELEINLRVCRTALDRSQEQLRQSLDTQGWLIAELKGLLAEKQDYMDQLITLKSNPDMRLLFLRASLRASQTALTKAQDEALGLGQTITYQCEKISYLKLSLKTATSTERQLASQANEMRQMMEEFISSARSHVTAYDNAMIVLEDNRHARADLDVNVELVPPRPLGLPPSPKCLIGDTMDSDTTDFICRESLSAGHRTSECSSESSSFDLEFVSTFVRPSSYVSIDPYAYLPAVPPTATHPHHPEYLGNAGLQGFRTPIVNSPLKNEDTQQHIRARNNHCATAIPDDRFISEQKFFLKDQRRVGREIHREDITHPKANLMGNGASYPRLGVDAEVARSKKYFKILQPPNRRNILFPRNWSSLGTVDPPAYEEGSVS